MRKYLIREFKNFLVAACYVLIFASISTGIVSVLMFTKPEWAQPTFIFLGLSGALGLFLYTNSTIKKLKNYWDIGWGFLFDGKKVK